MEKHAQRHSVVFWDPRVSSYVTLMEENRLGYQKYWHPHANRWTMKMNDVFLRGPKRHFQHCNTFTNLLQKMRPTMKMNIPTTNAMEKISVRDKPERKAYLMENCFWKCIIIMLILVRRSYGAYSRKEIRIPLHGLLAPCTSVAFFDIFLSEHSFNMLKGTCYV